MSCDPARKGPFLLQRLSGFDQSVSFLSPQIRLGAGGRLHRSYMTGRPWSGSWVGLWALRGWLPGKWRCRSTPRSCVAERSSRPTGSSQRGIASQVLYSTRLTAVTTRELRVSPTVHSLQSPAALLRHSGQLNHMYSAIWWISRPTGNSEN